MKSLFPQTLEAALAAERSLWKIGDALVDETEEAMNGKRGLKAVAEELRRYGIDYSERTLSHMRETARAFPRARRNHAVAFTTYTAAGNPDTLDVIMRAAAKSGHRVTQPYVESALATMRKQAREAREEEKAEAEREREKARAEEESARKREAAAAEGREREKAKRELARAREKSREAAAKAKAIKVQPKRAEAAPPAEEDVPALVAITGTLSDAGEAKRLAKKSMKSISAHIDDLKPSYIAGLTEAAMEAANAWREVADLVRKATPNKRGHLSVVNE